MNTYSSVLFVHVLGAVAMFAAFAVEVVSVERIRLASSRAEARAAIRSLPARAGPLAMLVTLLSGGWMMSRSWGPQPWLVGGLVGLVAMGALGGAVSQRLHRRLAAAIASESGDELPGAFRRVRESRALAVSIRLRISIGVGVLALMTLQPPGAIAASLVLAAAVLAGLVASARRPRTPRETNAPAPLPSSAAAR